MDLIGILDERLKKGEITLEQYHKMLAALHNGAESREAEEPPEISKTKRLPPTPPRIGNAGLTIKNKIILFFGAFVPIMILSVVLIALGLPRPVVVVVGILLMKFFTKRCWE